MKATELLKKDHQEVKAIFKELDRKGKDDPEEARRLFDRCAEELETHSTVEEELFYPELRDYSQTREIVLESTEEHHVVATLIEEMRGMSAESEAFTAKLDVLKENVLHHAGEEEKELFPLAEKLLGEPRLAWLGERMQARKKELMGQMGGGRPRKRA